MTLRRKQRLLVRTFPGWEVLRGAVARATGVGLDDVQARSERVNAVVWLDARAQVSAFQLVVTLELDLGRMPAATDLDRAAALAGALRDDVVLDMLEGDPRALRPLFRGGGGEGEVRVWMRADGSLGVEELVPVPVPPPVRDDRPHAVLARFEAQSDRAGGIRRWSRRVTHQIIANATEARLAVGRVELVDDSGMRRALFSQAAPPRALWAEVVFRANGEALAAIERSSADHRFAIELVTKEGYFMARSILPLAERSDEELAWSMRGLDASLALAVAAGGPLDESTLAELARLRAELTARGRA